MANIGAGYDLSVSTFSPDGRIFQIEYAGKASENGSTSVAIVCKDGVMFAAEKLLLSKMVVPGTSPHIFAVDKHLGICVSGFLSDGRAMVRTARLEAKNWWNTYSEPIPSRTLAERLCLYFQANTLAWTERPFGCSILLGGHENSHQSNFRKEFKKKSSFSLYCIDTAGTCYKYFGTALGKGRQIAKTELEKLNLPEITCEQALVPLAKIMHLAHEETRERDMELEMAWITEKTDFTFKMIDPEIIKIAYDEATREILAAEEDHPME